MFEGNLLREGTSSRLAIPKKVRAAVTMYALPTLRNSSSLPSKESSTLAGVAFRQLNFSLKYFRVPIWLTDSALYRNEYEYCSNDAFVCHMTGLNGEQCSKRSDGVWEPESKSLAPANLTLVNWSPAKTIFISLIGSSGVSSL